MNHKALALLAALSFSLLHSTSTTSHAHDVNPVQVSSFGSAATDVVLSGTNIYVSQGTNGLTIGDISDSLFLSGVGFLGSVDTPGYASGVAVTGNIALIADGAAGLEIIDVSNRAAPKIVGAYYTAGNCIAVATIGTLAYLADGDFGLEIVDFSAPTKPVRIGGYNTFGNATAVAVSGNYAM